MTSVPESLEKARVRLRRLMPRDILQFIAYLENEVRAPWTVLRLTIRVSAACLAISLLWSHDLWFQQDRLYLPSPLLPALARAPAGLNGLLYMATLACCAALFIYPRCRRLALLLVPIFGFFVLQDQMRGQFYIYMYVFNLAAAGAMPRDLEDSNLDALRFMTIGVYFWAGFYKINLYFMRFLFPWFVSPWFPYRTAAEIVGAAVPFLEALVGVFLLFVPTRWLGQALACCMLFAVMASLGPLGHNQALVVWPSNFHLDCLAVFLFLNNRRPLLSARIAGKPLCALAVFLFVFLPALGTVGMLGAHPSFKLYCACVPAAELEIGPRETLAGLPEALSTLPVTDHRIDVHRITYGLLHVSGCNAAPGDQPFIEGLRGFCPRLSDPGSARLHVTETIHFWSTETIDKTYDLCSPAPRLLSVVRMPPPDATPSGGIGREKIQ